MEWIETNLYWIIFVGSFLGVAVWETVRSRRQVSGPLGKRWGNHSLIWIAGSILTTTLFGVSPFLVALSVQDNNFGLLNQLWIPFVIRFVLTILLLDFTKYAIHRAWHSFPVLWRVHAVHHSDPEMDLSTSFRFHPIETLVTQGMYLAVVAVLAPLPVAVLIADLSRTFLSFLGHANASLPHWLEKPARWVLITPDLHRIHHSIEEWEQNRNFGDTFSWWDRLFRTYTPEPAVGQTAMVTGLRGVESDASLGLAFMLAMPFRPEPTEGPSPSAPTVTADQRS